MIIAFTWQVLTVTHNQSQFQTALKQWTHKIHFLLLAHGASSLLHHYSCGKIVELLLFLVLFSFMGRNLWLNWQQNLIVPHLLKKNKKQMLQQPGSIHILLNSRLIFNCAISPFWIYKFIILLLYFVNPLFSRKNLLRLKSNIQLCLFTTYKRRRSK